MSLHVAAKAVVAEAAAFAAAPVVDAAAIATAALVDAAAAAEATNGFIQPLSQNLCIFLVKTHLPQVAAALLVAAMK